ncbi:bola protein [Myxozyma melibiosi]|uniref:Bola protein n=1 Tax=Myxozyma melibiosi TaxID=54550 RepID=A0ABR1F4D5_9ASCO
MSEGVALAHLEDAIRTRLDAVHVEVVDMSGGCGQAFEVIIVSPIFSGKNRLMRHRLVNSALRDEIAQIHAFTQKDFTPEEWAKAQASS